MPHRQSDLMGLDGHPAAGVTIDRKIPLWGILTLVGAILGQGAWVWTGQREQAIEIRHQSEQIRELTAQVKALVMQMSAKDNKDVEQDFRINELGRRVQVLEATTPLRR